MTGKPSAGAEGARGRTGDDASEAERVVVRDKRKIDPTGARPAATAAGQPSGSSSPEPETGKTSDDQAGSGAAADQTGGSPAGDGAVGGLGAELESLRSALEERTRDLQRVTAEYANYRKRVERDRGLAAEQTTGAVLVSLLPILDDLDRAREHGDLVGPFGTVAEQLTVALSKFGLTAFGEKGDAFDPTRHEAVAHQTAPDVTEPTCVEVMRRGYTLGDRLLRPALVAVADPE